MQRAMTEKQREEILAAYRTRASAFDRVASRRARLSAVNPAATGNEAVGEGHGEVAGDPFAQAGCPPQMIGRFRDVLTLVADGATNDEIGSRLHVSAETVSWYLRRIYVALGARNRAHAVALAYRQGLLACDRAAAAPRTSLG